MRRTPKEWLSLQIAKNPRKIILIAIFLLNIAFFLVSALIISILSPSTVPYRGFWASVYYTVTMVLDAGCIEYVVSDIGRASVAIILVCIFIVIIGMIIFSGAIIGYVTNYISDFIATANAGGRALAASGHMIILNWNSRAAEVINDMLYSDHPETVVVMVHEGKEEIEQEVSERLADTVAKENAEVLAQARKLSFPASWIYIWRNQMRNRVTLIIREGDTFSTRQLLDVSVKQAKAVIILNQDQQRIPCKYETEQQKQELEKGNTNLIKTLIQVANMTGAEDSLDDQRVIVEVSDPGTQLLVDRIIAQKENLGKNNIIALPVNKILGRLLAQFSIMPELNLVYSELFSNKGAAFYTKNASDIKRKLDLRDYLADHFFAVPLTTMQTRDGEKCFLMAEHESHLDLFDAGGREKTFETPLELNRKYEFDRTNIIILGHNSNIDSIMEGFVSFGGEWNYQDKEQIARHGTSEVLRITVIDTPENLEKHDYYRKYPFVMQTIPATVFDQERICGAINDSLDLYENDTSVLILSDDRVSQDNLDASVLTYLIYIHDILTERMAANPSFDTGKLDVIVEILNPKNYDVVSNYSIDYIVISNRYLSRMVGQISEKEDIYQFYRDILTYDKEGADNYESMELYIKEAGKFFTKLPGRSTWAQLIRSVYDDGPEDNKSLLLGVIHKGGEMELFIGDQRKEEEEIQPDDKLIIFSNH